MTWLLPVLAWLGTEICWHILESRRPVTRLVAYLVCTAAILTIGSWLSGIAYERYFEIQYAERGNGKIGDRWATHIIFGTVAEVVTGTLALLCVSWGRRALVRSRALWPLALVLCFLALPLAFLSFLSWYGANSW